MTVFLRFCCLVMLFYGAKINASSGLEGQFQKAVFAGGCFWCMEPPFDEIDGVKATVSGYTGGHVKNPDYKSVTSGNTGHYEVIEVTYDPKRVTYAELLDVFWKNIDPLDDTGQFCDKGPQYKSAIFVADAAQKKVAQLSLDNLNQSGRLVSPVVTEILPSAIFYEAEKYHQDYYIKNPVRYKWYRTGCGRDRRLFELWGESSKE